MILAGLPLRVWLAIGAVVLAVSAFGIWLWRHDARVEERAAIRIEKKAEEHVRAADAVRDAVAGGARGLRDPYRRDRHAQE